MKTLFLNLFYFLFLKINIFHILWRAFGGSIDIINRPALPVGTFQVGTSVSRASSSKDRQSNVAKSKKVGHEH